MNTRTLRAIPAALLMTTAAAWSLPAAADNSARTRVESSRSAPAMVSPRSSTSTNVAQASGNVGSSTNSGNSAETRPAPAVTGLPPAIVPAMPASTASGAKPATPKNTAPGSVGAYGPSDTKSGTPAPKR